VLETDDPNSEKTPMGPPISQNRSECGARSRKERCSQKKAERFAEGISSGETPGV